MIGAEFHVFERYKQTSATERQGSNGQGNARHSLLLQSAVYDNKIFVWIFLDSVSQFRFVACKIGYLEVIRVTLVTAPDRFRIEQTNDKTNTRDMGWTHRLGRLESGRYVVRSPP